MVHDVRLIRSPISLTGMVITTISAVVFIVVLLGDLFGLHTNPSGHRLFSFCRVCSSALLIPFGAWVERRGARGQAAGLMGVRIDLNDPAQRAWRHRLPASRWPSS
jgi:hypothetical protein